MIPLETSDWQAQEGLLPKELKLGASGGLIISKNFSADSGLIGIGFKVPGHLGTAKMTLRAPFDFAELTILVPQGTLHVTAPSMTAAPGVEFSGKFFDALSLQGVQKGQQVEVSIGNVPEGRARSWMVGAITGGLLLFGGLGCALFTRPSSADRFGNADGLVI